MTNHELELFDQHPDWRLLLAAYQDRISAAKAEWSHRLVEVNGLAHEQLSTIHGKLIALGFLKFEIGDRLDGVQYQLTPLGRQALVPPESRQLVPEWMQTEAAETAAA